MQRSALLHLSACSPTEFTAYTPLLNEINYHFTQYTHDDNTHITPDHVWNWLIANTVISLEEIEFTEEELQVTKRHTSSLFSVVDSPIETLLPILRLLAHSRTNKILTLDHVFIQSEPLQIVLRNSSPGSVLQEGRFSNPFKRAQKSTNPFHPHLQQYAAVSEKAISTPPIPPRPLKPKSRASISTLHPSKEDVSQILPPPTRKKSAVFTLSKPVTRVSGTKEHIGPATSLRSALGPSLHQSRESLPNASLVVVKSMRGKSPNARPVPPIPPLTTSSSSPLSSAPNSPSSKSMPPLIPPKRRPKSYAAASPVARERDNPFDSPTELKPHDPFDLALGAAIIPPPPRRAVSLSYTDTGRQRKSTKERREISNPDSGWTSVGVKNEVTDWITKTTQGVNEMSGELFNATRDKIRARTGTGQERTSLVESFEWHNNSQYQTSRASDERELTVDGIGAVELNQGVFDTSSDDEEQEEAVRNRQNRKHVKEESLIKLSDDEWGTQQGWEVLK